MHTFHWNERYTQFDNRRAFYSIYILQRLGIWHLNGVITIKVMSNIISIRLTWLQVWSKVLCQRWYSRWKITDNQWCLRRRWLTQSFQWYFFRGFVQQMADRSSTVTTKHAFKRSDIIEIHSMRMGRKMQSWLFPQLSSTHCTNAIDTICILSGFSIDFLVAAISHWFHCVFQLSSLSASALFI